MADLPSSVKRQKTDYWMPPAVYRKYMRYASYIWCTAIAFVVFVAVMEPNVIHNMFYTVHDSTYQYTPYGLGLGNLPHESHVASYMDEQISNIQANRSKFLLWDYFDMTKALENGASSSWQNMIRQRMEMMVEKLEAHQDKRFNVEKDKCVTMEILGKLGLPFPKLQFKAKIEEYEPEKLKSFLASAKYPSILKVGHIHQQRSTLFLSSSADVQSKLDEYVDWTTEKMHSKFVDNNPAWMDSTNKLYAAIDPCMFVQDVINPEGFGEGKTERPLELMVEVLWGQPTHAVLTTTVRGELALGKTQYKNTEEYMVLNNGWVSYHWPKTKWSGNPLFNERSKVLGHRLSGGISWFKGQDPATTTAADRQEACQHPESHDVQYCMEEYDEIQQDFWTKYGSLMKHIPRVWNVCGALGTGIGADYVRCDVFVTPTGDVSVNEISLSSNWGNALSPAWQQRFIHAWVSGYDKSADCIKGTERCGSGFSGKFGDGVEGKKDQFVDIPSPVYKAPTK
eukprot:m.100569 g.100569  ORF g.100569 m.100569 type:complete len:509 (-) comp27256_c1_seq1:33-1559(-)